MYNLRNSLLLFAILTAVFALIGPGCSGTDTDGTANGKDDGQIGKPVPVKVATPIQRTVERHLELPATVHAVERVRVSTRVPGYIQPYLYDTQSPECARDRRMGKDESAPSPGTCRFEIGDQVTKGEVIALIQTPETEAMLAQALAAREASEANVGVATAGKKIKDLKYTRLKSVVEKDQGLLAQQKVDEARLERTLASAKIKASRSRLKEIDAKIRRLETELSFREVRAPFSGTVTRRYADSGALVGPGIDHGGGKGAILEIVRNNQMAVRIPVPEGEASYVKAGSTPVSLDIPQANIMNLQQTVTRTRKDIDVHSRTLTAEIVLEDPKDALPGMLGKASLTVLRREDALVVPATALVSQQGKMFLFTVKNGKAVELPVEIGIDDGKTVEITKGINANDQIVIQTRTPLSDGQACEVTQVQK